MPLYNTTIRNQRLDVITNVLGPAATMRVYSGTPPATANEGITTQTLLVTINCDATVFASPASGGQLVPQPFSTNNIAVGTGIPSFARFYVDTDNVSSMQISAGIRQGELQFSKKIIAGASINITDMSIFESEELPNVPSAQPGLYVIAGHQYDAFIAGGTTSLNHSLKPISGTFTSTKVKIWNGNAFVWFVLNASTGTNDGTAVATDPSSWGPEAEIALQYEQSAATEIIYLINHVKASLGGEPYGEGTLKTGTGDWATDGIMYTSLVSEINNAKLSLGNTAPIKMLWTQGWADARGQSDFSNVYATNLTGVITALKTAVNEPEMEIIVARSAPWDWLAEEGIYDVREAQENFAASSSKYTLLNTDGFTRQNYDAGARSDALDAAGSMDLGNRTANLWFSTPVVTYSGISSHGDGTGIVPGTQRIEIETNDFEIEVLFTLPDGFGNFSLVSDDDTIGICSKGNIEDGIQATGDYEWAMYMSWEGQLVFSMSENGIGSTSSVSSQLDFDDFDAETQYSFKATRVANLLKLFVDAVEVDSLDTTTTRNIVGRGDLIFLGGDGHINAASSNHQETYKAAHLASFPATIDAAHITIDSDTFTLK